MHGCMSEGQALPAYPYDPPPLTVADLVRSLQDLPSDLIVQDESGSPLVAVHFFIGYDGDGVMVRTTI